MPEPLKNLYNKELIENLNREVVKQHPAFDQNSFTRAVFNTGWKEKELKQRMRHIAECLHQYLPSDYNESIKILIPVSAKFTGFEFMFFQDYVECYGLDEFETSIPALEHFTKFSSSEFAVRAFILQDERRMMKQMLDWARSDNHHVRRLASEGCRPRLPWATSLPAFKNNPRPVLPVLKILMNDESEYVRRSVANNLNDISKDNPDIVLDWAEQWLNTDDQIGTQTTRAQTNALIKHACRSLLKQGDKKALSLFGFTEARHITVCKFNVQKKVTLGESLPFSFLLRTHNKKLGRCRIEFAIDFMKANGSLNRKVFKISESDYEKKEKQITKYFSFKRITTRKYYTGKHQLTIIINGVDQLTKSFVLNL